MASAAKPESPVTPMMAQYLSIKAEAGDCLLFYRMGDFFELFFDDAKIAAAALDIALTSRGEHDGRPIPMCGVPAHAAETYLARLIKAGHRVAIAEQTETPDEAKARAKREGRPASKAPVNRAIIRVVTAGTLTEDSLLDSKRANWIAAVGRAQGKLGLAAADISTGRFELMSLDEAELAAEIARLGPAELIVAEGILFDHPELIERPGSEFDSGAGEARLKSLYGVATLDGFGSFDRASLAAAAGLIDYLSQMARGNLPYLQPPTGRNTAAHMAIDAATRASLELVEGTDGGRANSLLDAIDRTVTGAGARLLAQDISAPLNVRDAVESRLDMVGWLIDAPLLRERLRETLRQLPDIGRAMGRVVAGRGSPRDLAQLRDGLDGARNLREALAKQDLPTLAHNLLPAFDGHGTMVDEFRRALVAAPPIDTSQGGYIGEGYDAALDELRRMAGDGRRAIAQLEAKYRTETGIATLKIRHNGVLGYHIEVPARSADGLMRPESGFTHRQTMANVVRFNAPALHEEAMRVAEAGNHALAAEASHLEALTELALAAREPVGRAADALARFDVAAALAERAIEEDWCRPHFDEGQVFRVEGGRHPVVEAAVRRAGEPFVANDLALDEDDRLWLVSGPNMGGKSTFLRQNAVIAVLAQAGSHVPARSATLSLVDRLFSRVGASDNLARGRSTFMVEMVETAAILAQATENSFVILDEVGRGTSTYDGLSIAWAVVEAVHDINRCRCLFATHYHELTRLAERLEAMSLHHVRAREWKGDLVLLHELADGPADRSYGLAVGKLAGLSPAVLSRAAAVLKKLEAGRAATGGLAAGLDDLPLFAASPEAEAAASDELREALSAIDADALSPREALEQIYRLKGLAAGD